MGLLSSEENEEEENQAVSRVDLWLLMALVLFCAVVNVRLKVPVLPQTGLLLGVGVLLRCVGTFVTGVETSVKHMDGITADTIMLFFLPALIAECALSLDWYTFKREIGQILTLATSAVLMSSFLTGFVVKYILNYDEEFDWYSAMLIGAILSATDHVSVVAILKEIQTDDKLQVLMQGETLINDGTVLALFEWLLSGATEKVSAAEELTELFFRLTLGGLAWGLAFSVVISIWLSKLVDHVVLETLLTIMCAYLLFYTAELETLHFSGGIAVVVFGLYMSAYGKGFISPLIEKSMHTVWSMLGTVIEALVLILGGSLLGTTLMNKEHLHYHDIWMAFALFPLLHVVRAIVIFVHWPLLNFFGYGCTFKQAIILIFGALKGSMSIVLGLIVYSNDYFSPRQQEIVLFWSCAISAMCISVDSIIVKVLIRRFGFEEMTAPQKRMLFSFSNTLLKRTNKEMEKMSDKPDFLQANLEDVSQHCASDTMMRKRLGKLLKIPKTKLIESFFNFFPIKDHEMEIETRRRFYCILKKLYWHNFEHGSCFRESASRLIESADRSLDDKDKKMGDWPIVEPWLLPRRILKLLNCFKSCPCIGHLCLAASYWYFTRAYDTAVNFIKAHKKAEKRMKKFGKSDKKWGEFKTVMEESQEQVKAADHFLKENLKKYPEVHVFVQTYQTKHKLLYSELKHVEKTYKEGAITKIEYSQLKRFVQRKIKKLVAQTSPRPPTLVDSLQANFLFNDLLADALKKLVQGLEESTRTERTKLQLEAEEGNALVVVLKGRALEKGRRYEIEHCPGDVIGTQFLLAASEFSRERIDVEFVDPSSIVHIPILKIENLRRKSATFNRKMLILCARNALKMTPQSFGDLGSLSAEYHSTVFDHCSLELLETGQSFALSLCSVLLEGSLSNGISALAYIDGRQGHTVTASCPCTLLKLAKKYQDCMREENFDGQAKPVRRSSLKLGAIARNSQLVPRDTEQRLFDEMDIPLLPVN